MKRHLVLSVFLAFSSASMTTGCAHLPAVIQVTEKILVMLSEAQSAIQAAKLIVENLVALRPDLVSNPVVRRFFQAQAKAQAALQHASQATQAARRAEASPDPLTVFAEFKTAYAEMRSALEAVEALAKSVGAGQGMSFQIETPEAAL